MYLIRNLRFWLVAAIFAAALVPTSASAWWNQDWSYRKEITIDLSPKGANISEPVGQMAVLIRLHSANFTFDDAQQAGNDIRFVAEDDKTPLPFHIESYDPLLGLATVWVNVSDLPPGGIKKIWLYYGNAKATPGSDAKGTFDVDYTLVYHFDGAAAQPAPDRTAYNNNATTAVGTDESAIVGKGARITGTSGVQVAASPSLAITAGGSFTFEGWVKPAAAQPNGAIFARRDGTSALLIGLANGVPFADVRGGTPGKVTAAQAIPLGQWSHIAVTASADALTLFVNGQRAATAPAVLAAFNTPLAIGADVAGQTEFAPLAGSMDEVRLSKIARPAPLILADAMAQGAESKLVAYGVDEKQSGFGFGYFGIIIQNVTLDAWVVIAILGVMALISWLVMWNKWSYIGRVDRANDSFLHLYRKHGGDPISLDRELGQGRARRVNHSSIFRIYRAGADEIERRNEHSTGRVVLNTEAIEVVRALMDSAYVRENQRLARQMVLLTISISGGPFLGLLGTVVGVMITFAAIAATGDVNINAIAPGISAALLATVCGLAVAIPALFGYNYLLTRIKNIGADMQVFVDEFVTRTSENFGAGASGMHAAVARAH